MNEQTSFAVVVLELCISVVLLVGIMAACEIKCTEAAAKAHLEYHSPAADQRVTKMLDPKKGG